MTQPESSKKVAQWKYTVVFDLNGVVFHRSYIHSELHVEWHLGVTTFLNWLHGRAGVAFWSSVTSQYMDNLLDILFVGCSFSRREVICLAQCACTKSMYKASTTPNKPVFLKDLTTFAHVASLSSFENILLIDDNPQKNLLNDLHNDVFPQSYRGELNDNYLQMQLMSWLNGLMLSNEVVPEYVRNNPLPGG